MYLCSFGSINIKYLPPRESIRKARKGEEITLGDLHGNAMKLLHLLILHGMVTHSKSNEFAADYQKLFQIYNETHLEKLDTLSKLSPTAKKRESIVLELQEEISVFGQILDKLTFETDATLRLIGDELADRGTNDVFTLMILCKVLGEPIDSPNVQLTNKQRTNRIIAPQKKLEIILSNHALDFLHNYANNDSYTRHGFDTTANIASSMTNMARAIEEGVISREEVDNAVDYIYSRSLKMLSYTIMGKEEICIYSHAPISLKHLKRIATLLNIAWPFVSHKPLSLQSDAEVMVILIDQINQKFQEHWRNSSKTALMTLFKHAYVCGGNNGFVWTREDAGITQELKGVSQVHGHDRHASSKVPNVFNLDRDNLVGKPGALRGKNEYVLSIPYGIYDELEHDTESTQRRGKQTSTIDIPAVANPLPSQGRTFGNKPSFAITAPESASSELYSPRIIDPENPVSELYSPAITSRRNVSPELFSPTENDTMYYPITTRFSNRSFNGFCSGENMDTESMTQRESLYDLCPNSAELDTPKKILETTESAKLKKLQSILFFSDEDSLEPSYVFTKDYLNEHTTISMPKRKKTHSIGTITAREETKEDCAPKKSKGKGY